MSTHHDDKRRRGQQEGGHPGGDEGDLGVTGGAQRLAEKRVGDDEIPENRQQALFTFAVLSTDTSASRPHVSGRRQDHSNMFRKDLSPSYYTCSGACIF